jgi:dienelactone hydrolase
MILKIILSVLVLAALPTLSIAQQFQVSPAGTILLGDPVAITLRGMPAKSDITIRAERVFVNNRDQTRTLNRSEATYLSDAEGSIDLATVAPKSGSYRGADPRGLFWSMRPTKEEGLADRPNMEVRLTASTADGKVLARSAITFVRALASVKMEKVEAFPGAVFASQGGEEKRPAVILLGGFEGGSAVTNGVAPLASHGFAVLALPYYSPLQWPSKKAELPTLPQAFADIPVERLNEARAWLRARPDVDATRIAIHGTSKGAEFALLAGVHLQWPTAIVAIVPSDVVWEGWGEGIEVGTRSSFSINGKPLPFVPYKGFAAEFKGFEIGEPVYVRRPQDNGRAAHPAAAVAARIPVEKIKAPVMVVGGHDDQIWASGMMAQNIAERRAEAQLETLAIIHPKAGHYLGGIGYSPTMDYNDGLSKPGGNPQADAEAQTLAWTQSIAFLKKHLKVN